MGIVMARSLADIMRIVENMLARAEGLEQTSPEEAKLMRSKAEEWMVKYRLQEEDLIAESPGSLSPIERDLDIVGAANEFRNEHFWMLGDIAKHCGVMWEYHWVGARYAAKLVGYEGDLRYAEFLYQSARLVFASKLTPDVDRSLNDQENVYRMRSAGMQRNRIAALLWGSSMTDGVAHGRVQKLYVAACRERHEDAAVSGRQINAKTYREVYAREFVNQLHRRLQDARDSAGEAGGLPELHGRKERVQEYFWTRFPHRRPKATEETKPAKAGPCTKCQKAKTGHCREHPAFAVTKADQARYDRLWGSATAQRGSTAGREAANLVVLQRGHHTNRVESGDVPEIES
jgi:hypothetical protein